MCSLVPTARAQLGPVEASGHTAVVGYFIGTGEPGSAYRSGDRALAHWALEAWERALDGALHFMPASENAARLRLYWVAADAGEYGEMRPIEVTGERGAAVFIRPDTDALGADIAALAREDPLYRDTIVYLTCLHEIGHALGLAHTADPRDVMYFFGFGGDVVAFFARFRTTLGTRADIATHPGLSAGDLAQLAQRYGSEAGRVPADRNADH